MFGNVDMAIAGGISIDFYPEKSGTALENFIKNKDRVVKTFDEKADGTIWGEGVGVVLLKPLEKAIQDRDNIQCVIKGIAVNNDGQSNGILAPNPKEQQKVITATWEKAGINPETIQYIEAHGTGIKLGNPIEIKGLTATFSQYINRKQFCAIGSVKGNIGHVQAASGMASLIKVILSIKNKRIPPSLIFRSQNSYINFYKSPVYLNDKVRKWFQSNEKITVGINSFGFSGTNCHVIVQEYKNEQKQTNIHKNEFYVMILSENSLVDLRSLIKNIICSFKNEIPIVEKVCFTSNIDNFLSFLLDKMIVFLKVLFLKTSLPSIDNPTLSNSASNFIINNEFMPRLKKSSFIPKALRLKSDFNTLINNL